MNTLTEKEIKFWGLFADEWLNIEELQVDRGKGYFGDKIDSSPAFSTGDLENSDIDNSDLLALLQENR